MLGRETVGQINELKKREGKALPEDALVVLAGSSEARANFMPLLRPEIGDLEVLECERTVDAVRGGVAKAVVRVVLVIELYKQSRKGGFHDVLEMGGAVLASTSADIVKEGIFDASRIPLLRLPESVDFDQLDGYGRPARSLEQMIAGTVARRLDYATYGIEKVSEFLSELEALAAHSMRHLEKCEIPQKLEKLGDEFLKEHAGETLKELLKVISEVTDALRMLGDNSGKLQRLLPNYSTGLFQHYQFNKIVVATSNIGYLIEVASDIAKALNHGGATDTSELTVWGGVSGNLTLLNQQLTKVFRVCRNLDDALNGRTDWETLDLTLQERD